MRSPDVRYPSNHCEVVILATDAGVSTIFYLLMTETNFDGKTGLVSNLALAVEWLASK